jgi:hypothetical protein
VERNVAKVIEFYIPDLFSRKARMRCSTPGKIAALRASLKQSTLIALRKIFNVGFLRRHLQEAQSPRLITVKRTASKT